MKRGPKDAFMTTINLYDKKVSNVQQNTAQNLHEWKIK